MEPVLIFGMIACLMAGNVAAMPRENYERAKEQQCYLRVNLKPCSAAIELLLYVERSQVWHYKPDDQERHVCLPVSCDDNGKSATTVELMATTHDSKPLDVKPANQFGTDYDELYRDLSECEAGQRSNAVVNCDNVVAIEQEEHQVTERALQNDWDQRLWVQCDNRQAFWRVYSHHDNGKEDRRWEWNCRTATDYDYDDCYWTGYVNGFDQPFVFQCAADYVLAGADSYHDNGREDRRWKFRCCHAPSHYTRQCYTSGYVNSWDGVMDYRQNSPRVFVGVFSYHDNGKEDRLWQVMSCNYVRCENF